MIVFESSRYVPQATCSVGSQGSTPGSVSPFSTNSPPETGDNFQSPESTDIFHEAKDTYFAEYIHPMLMGE